QTHTQTWRNRKFQSSCPPDFPYPTPDTTALIEDPDIFLQQQISHAKFLLPLYSPDDLLEYNPDSPPTPSNTNLRPCPKTRSKYPAQDVPNRDVSIRPNRDITSRL